jgi:hypothetical protein
MPTEKEKLDRIHLALIEAIEEMSPEELRQHLANDGEDPDEIVERHRKIVSSVVAKSRRGALLEARAALDDNRHATKLVKLPSTPAARLVELRRLLSDPSTPRTLAARAGTGEQMSDAEVSSLIANLLELGVGKKAD